MQFLEYTLILLAVMMAVAFIRLAIGPTIWDRILMLNLISIKVILFVVIYAILNENLLLLDIALSYGIIGFLTMTLLAKFIMTGGREK